MRIIINEEYIMKLRTDFVTNSSSVSYSDYEFKYCKLLFG